MGEPRDYEQRFTEEDAIRRRMPNVKPERISDDELGEMNIANMLVALNPLLEQSLTYEQESDSA